MNWNLAWQQLVLRAESLGYTVITRSREHYVRVDKKEVHIAPKGRVSLRVCILAHEIGHVISRRRCVELFGSSRTNENNKTPAPWYLKECELMAWAVADRLARKYKFYCTTYLKTKHKFLGSYYK